MIPAENFILNKFKSGENCPPTPKDVESWLIEFAKMHVEAALKEALSKMYIETDLKGRVKGVNENSILNAYPLTNII